MSRIVPESISPAVLGGLGRLPPGASRTAVATAGIAVAGLAVVAALWMTSRHPPDDTVFYDYLDKRWIIALYAVGVLLVYLPPAVKQWFDRAGGCAGAAAQVSIRAGPRGLAVHCLCALFIGFGLALVDIGPHVPAVLERVWEAHELVHLGPFQRIANGGIPYVEAQTQYGPGHQLISYVMMRDTEFTLRGFRASFFALNLLAEGLWFSLMLAAFGWAGLATIVLSRLFCPVGLLTFVGWYVEFRWLGPFLIGLPLALVLWIECRKSTRFGAIAALGCLGGVLAWFSQENLTAITATVGLVTLAGFARRRLSLGSGVAVFGAFALCQIVVFLTLLAATVGLGHLSEALSLYSRTGALWLNGLANTPWSPTAWRPGGEVWTPAFYATPCTILILSGLAIWAPRPETGTTERGLGLLLATAAAAGSVVPMMLLRSDEPHFLGPAAVLPALLVFSIAVLPDAWTSERGRRAGLRLALAAVLGLIFVAPLGLESIASRLIPRVGAAWDGAQALAGILGGAPQELAGAAMMERRSGFRMVPGAGPVPMGREQPCYYYFSATCGEVSGLIDEIREAIGKRTVFLDVGTSAVSSPVYFFGDLHVQYSKPELISTIWVQEDRRELRAELRRNPPDCVVNWGHGTETGLLLELYQNYSSTPIRNGVIHCRS